MEQRKRRRKKCRNGRPMAVDSGELVNSEKSSVDMTQLAHKYMQKCRVESSTDSESDANTEFLDPYDGDYEEASGTSDCSLDSLVDACPRKGIFLKHPVPEGLTVEENFSPEQLFASPYRGVSATVTHETDCTKPRDNLMLTGTATEDDGKGLPSRLSWEAEPYEIVLQPTTEPSWFMQDIPSECSRFSENVAPASVPRPAVSLSDKRACEDAIIKRKQGQPIPESAGEKLRKKLRAT
ncbi:UNVERIFIED_CONTAM: hypothetical protein K2H54_025592 [Gekko kuhli]